MAIIGEPTFPRGYSFDMELERAAEIMNALAEHWAALDGLERIGDDTWLIGLEDGTAMLAEWADAPGHLVLTAPLGRPAMERRFAVYEWLLRLNGIPRETGGLNSALGSVEGDLIATLTLSAADCTAADVEERLAQWSSQIRVLAEFVSAPAEVLDLPAPVLNAVRA
jgi:hypothetical protein